MSARPLLYTTLALLLVALVVAPAGAAEQDKDVRIQIKKVHVECDDADSEDCSQRVLVEHKKRAHQIRIQGTGAHAFAFAGDGGGKGGHLGVGLTELSAELKSHFGLPDSSGVMVSKVMDESPALSAGLEVGDIISAIDGEAVSSPAELAHAIRSREGGDTVVVEAWRDGKLVQLPATLAETDTHARLAHTKIIECKDGEDCDVQVEVHSLPHHGLSHDFGCEEDDCEILIECDNGECECAVNGEAADCDDLE